MKKVTSPYLKIKKSSIHSKGGFAKRDIPKGTRVIEYVGEKLTKAQSSIRADVPLEKHKKDKSHGAVYLFELNKRYDVDGNVKYNTARFINHSCDPNCETDIIKGKIYIIAIKDIKKGDEITYNYGYGWEDYKDHRCECGSDNCMGYILSEDHWKKLKRKIKEKKAKRALKKNKKNKKTSKNGSLKRSRTLKNKKKRLKR